MAFIGCIAAIGSRVVNCILGGPLICLAQWALKLSPSRANHVHMRWIDPSADLPRADCFSIHFFPLKPARVLEQGMFSGHV